MNKCSIFATMFAGALAVAPMAASAVSNRPGNEPDPRLLDPGVNRLIPVVGWKVDAAAGIEKLNALAAKGGRVQTKAASDFATIFRPVTPCRLVDTRGSAPITGGAFAPYTRRTMLTNGNCGVPTSFVRGISLTLITLNLTPNTGGFISLLAPVAPISGTNDTFNFGAQWSGTSVNVPTNSAGSFDVYVDQATAHVIIDINGYYQDLDELTVNTQMDIKGTTGGDLLSIQQLQSGSSALNLFAAGNGRALSIQAGSVHATGAGVGTNTFSFVHKVDTAIYPTGTRCSGFANYSVIDHALVNGRSGAMIQITPRSGNTLPSPADGMPTAYYCSGGCGGCTGADNKWLLYTGSGNAHVDDSEFNMLIILP